MHLCRRRWLVVVLCAPALGAAEAPNPSQWALSKDGAYVLDARAQVAWPRCVEGMHWNGKACGGTPLLLTHAEAMALVQSRVKASGLQWRMPRVKELQGLVQKEGAPAGLDPQFFPAALPGWYWSSTAAINTAPVNQYDYGNIAQGRNEQTVNRIAFLHGWAVNLATGEARGDVVKRTKLPVRLVLPLD